MRPGSAVHAGGSELLTKEVETGSCEQKICKDHEPLAGIGAGVHNSNVSATAHPRLVEEKEEKNDANVTKANGEYELVHSLKSWSNTGGELFSTWWRSCSVERMRAMSRMSTARMARQRTRRPALRLVSWTSTKSSQGKQLLLESMTTFNWELGGC